MLHKPIAAAIAPISAIRNKDWLAATNPLSAI